MSNRARASEWEYAGSLLSLRVSSLTHPGRVRQNNEDAVGLPPAPSKGDQQFGGRGYLFLVADGVGGQASGEVASKLAVQSVLDYYYGADGGYDVGGVLNSAYHLAHRKVLAEAQRTGQQGMGSTLVGVLVRGETAIVTNVGDSRAYLWRNGRLTQITRDHSLVAEQVRMGTITPEQARSHPMRHVILQSIGGQEALRPDQFELTLQAGDRILLCTDGLTDVVSDQQIAATLGKSSPSAAAERLVQAALAAGGPDNVSVMVIEATALQEAHSPPEQARVNPLWVALFLAVGLAVVLAILYFVAKAVLAEPTIPQQAAPPQPHDLCEREQFQRGAYGAYLEGLVEEVRPPSQPGEFWQVDIRNSSGEYHLQVDSAAIADTDFRPREGDTLTAFVVPGDTVNADTATSGFPSVGLAIEIDVQRIGLFSSKWGNWVYDEERLAEYQWLYASSIDRRWTYRREKNLEVMRVATPLLLQGTWSKGKELPYFDVHQMYTWNRAGNCYENWQGISGRHLK